MSHVVQINVSDGGVPKLPISGPVLLTPLGVPGDRQHHLKFHGGPNKALLVIASEVVDELKALGYPVVYGSLGENITVAESDPALWRTGQRYEIGNAVIEFTTLRQPCHQLDPYGRDIGKHLWNRAGQAGDTNSPVWARGGFYARVIRPGAIGAGAPVRLLSDLA